MSRGGYKTWAREIGPLLVRLAELDLGYPLGENVVREPTATKVAVPKVLRNLYKVCDGISLPDVHIGYFVDTADRLLSAAARGEPTTIASESSSDTVVPFGSDGGGGRFVVSEATGSVYYLPSGGKVADGIYFSDNVVMPQRLAESVLGFLWRVHDDVAAFVSDKDPHPKNPQETR